MIINDRHGHRYRHILEFVSGYGNSVSPRGEGTVESEPIVLTVPAGLVYTRSGINPSLLLAEALSMVAGETNYAALEHASPSAYAAGYFNDRKSEYGEATVGILECLLDDLRKDRYTRQAYYGILHDVKTCTIGLQATLRDSVYYGGLTLTAFMRSTDVWRGMPYNMAIWGMLALWLKQQLRTTDPAWLRLVMNTPHVYNEDLLSDKGLEPFGTARQLVLDPEVYAKPPQFARNLAWDTLRRFEDWMDPDKPIWERVPDGIRWDRVP